MSMFNAWLLMMVILVGCPAVADAKQWEENLEQVYFLALDGNVKAAMEKLESIDPKKLSRTEVNTRRRYFQRFGADVAINHPTGPGLITEVVGIYRSYWHRVLLQRLDQIQGHQYLFDRLSPIVQRLGGSVRNFSESELEKTWEFLAGELRKSGYYAKFGSVRPHLNFMAWKKQTIKKFQVSLGNGEIESVDVVLMEDFVSLGWAAYATFDKMHVGGWVGDDALFCVASSYDLGSENFKVSFLAHEARHFSDKRKFTDLSSADLEYRAKLTEVFLAQISFKDVMRKFILEQRDNPENPHSYASHRLVTALSGKLGEKLNLHSIRSIEKVAIQRKAKELLAEDTERLRFNGGTQLAGERVK